VFFLVAGLNAQDVFLSQRVTARLHDDADVEVSLVVRLYDEDEDEDEEEMADLPIHPPPLPGQDCQAVGGWPKFTDYNHLKGDNWGRYFEAVYGEVPDSGYPICLSDFWVLYEQELEKAGITTPNTPSQCPTDASESSKGELFSSNQGPRLSAPGVKAIFHPPAFGAFPDNTWVEVSHRAFPKDEHFGAWFYYAKGSGMWYNIGKSIAFQDHQGAYEHYGADKSDHWSKRNEVMSKLCAAAGDDTIQFLNHVDGGTCNDCCRDSTPSEVSWNYEFVACAMKGKYACAAEPGDTTLKAGWMGKRNCECVEDGLKLEDEEYGHLNCKGVPKR
jgi:hypothetical protein